MSPGDRRTLTTADDLVAAGLADPAQSEGLQRVADRYAVAITPAMARLILPGDPADPIARQFVPDARELILHREELSDPIGDEAKSPVRGIVHRYPDRVLLKAIGTCPVYCRFCFRREMVGPQAQNTLTAAELDAALAYIAAHPAIWEVIVTGGDPLMLSPRRIRELAAALGAIAHVKVVRWHSRVPVVAPERVTDDLAAALGSGRQPGYVAIHANHPRELTGEARLAIARLHAAGLVLVSQSVLLKGVNDDADTLEALMRAFVEARVKPYYLHHPDLAPGTAHLRTTLAAGQALMQELRGRLSGLALPAYVLDIPGGHGKVPAGAAHVDLDPATGRARSVADAAGRRHPYTEPGDRND